MAVAFEMRFRGGTVEQYDQVLDLMGLSNGGAGPKGLLFHWAAPTDEGLLVVDVWETAEQFERFSKEQIGPFTQQAGFEGPPQITTHEVHSHMTAP